MIKGRSFFSTIFWLLTISAGLNLTACNRSSEAPDTIAKVGDHTLTINDYKQRLAQYGYELGDKTIESNLKEKILNDMIEQALLLEEAQRRSIRINSSELNNEMKKVRENYPGREFEKLLVKRRITLEQWKDNLRDSLIQKKVVSRITDNSYDVTDAELKKYYEENKNTFVQPEQARALHILVKTEQEAFDVLAQLRKGVPFETVARERSQGPEAQKGGDLGYFHRGVMPEIFDDTVFNIKIGNISRVVSSEYGFHIFKVVDRRPKHFRPFAEVKHSIKQELVESKKRLAYTQWLEDALKNAKILRNRELIAKL